MRRRIIYFITILITIATGLFVRVKQQWFPDIVNLYLGDMLYAFMMYYIVSFILINKNSHERVAFSFAICLMIEVFQLYQSEWINTVRQTLPGRLILGFGFLWSDLLAYLLGVTMAFFFEKIMLSKGSIAH